MVHLIERRAALAWAHEPIPGFSLSAAGLLALADLSTVAKRTALKGSASWLDALLLAPGMHNQQLADVLGNSAPVAAQSLQTGQIYRLANRATVQYLWRVSQPGHLVVLDVRRSSEVRHRARPRYPAPPKNSLARGFEEEDIEPLSDFLSTALYLIGPALTIVSLILLGLTQDWWGLGIIFMMMTSRALNIWIIHQRLTDTDDEEDTDHKTFLGSRHGNRHSREISEFMIYLGPSRGIQIRGYLDDLKAVCGAWMRDKTAVEGYLEAAAKILVYMTAVFSGNVYQTGNIIILGLLLVSSAALALSNEAANNLQMHGRQTSISSATPMGPVTLSEAGLRVEVADTSRFHAPYPPPAKQDTGLSSQLSAPAPWKGWTPEDTFSPHGVYVEESFGSHEGHGEAAKYPTTSLPGSPNERRSMLRRGRHEPNDTQDSWDTPPRVVAPPQDDRRYYEHPTQDSDQQHRRDPYEDARRRYAQRHNVVSTESGATLTTDLETTLESDDFERRHGPTVIDKRFPFADDTDYV